MILCFSIQPLLHWRCVWDRCYPEKWCFPDDKHLEKIQFKIIFQVLSGLIKAFSENGYVQALDWKWVTKLPMSKTLQKASGVVQQHLKNDKVHSLKTNQEEMRDGTRFLHSNAYRRKFAFLLLILSFLDWFLCIFSYIFPETSQTLTVSEDPNLLYELISSGTLKDAYMHGKL